MREVRRRVTVADVARVAGVSTATVSYVLNSTPNQKISAGTRQRVHDAVAKLDYTRSAAARALSRGRSDIVLLALPLLPIGPHFAQLVEVLTDDLGKAGLSLVTHLDQADRPMARFWREMAPEAIITFAPVDPLERRAMRAAGIYVAGLRPNQSSTGQEPDVLVVSSEDVGRQQVEHLATVGHRHLGYAAPADERLKHLVEWRLSGAAAACRELGLDAPITQTIPPSIDAAATAVAAWQQTVPHVTAVCAYNDEVAFALLAGMRASGLTAPTDIAVIGVDNIPTAPFADPPLSTIDIDVHEMSAQLTQMVANGITGKQAPPPDGSTAIRLVLRESA